jgi:protein O-GlcNAc transferase
VPGAYHRRRVAAEEGSHSALFDDALAHYQAGRLIEASSACAEGLRRSPSDAALHTLSGDVCHAQGDLDGAIAAYERALSIDEALQGAWYGSGCAWLTKKVYATALVCLERAAALAPADAACHHNVGTAQFKLGLVDEAMRRFRASLAMQENFLPRTAIATLVPGSPGADHAAVLAARREWGDIHLPRRRRDVFAREPRSESPLRIGYLSSFFDSPNWMKPVWGLVNNHDRRNVEIHLFSDCAEGPCAGYERHDRDRCHDISRLSNRDAAASIESSEIDVLVDLNGYSRVPRLAVLALRPAPVQVAWFNMYATSGLSCFDYLIGDEHVVSPEEERFYTERIVRVPGSYLTFDVRYAVPDVADPPAIANGYLTFGCLASQYKITPPVVESWSAILARSASSKLFLKNAALEHQANRDHLADRFRRHGIAADRLELSGPAEHAEFLAAYSRIDVALDTFPYNGGTTTSEAMWQGVPVLTFRGDRWASRQSTSLMRTAGLDDFVGRDVSDYIDRAVRLAEDPQSPPRLTDLRRGMRARLTASPLCDTASFARAMEAKYREFAAAATRPCAIEVPDGVGRLVIRKPLARHFDDAVPGVVENVGVVGIDDGAEHRVPTTAVPAHAGDDRRGELGVEVEVGPHSGIADVCRRVRRHPHCVEHRRPVGRPRSGRRRPASRVLL